MQETFQNKYHMVFEKDSNPIIMNDPQFHGSVTFNAGQTKGLPPTSEKVKAAIETLDKEGLLTEDTLWWAIYRVLTMPQYGYPTSKPEFCKTIENLGLEVARGCVYENWRKVQLHKLTTSPDLWGNIENLGDAEYRQRKVATRLLELLQS